MTQQQLTIEEMTERLHERAEEIFILSSIVTRRGLAHAFIYLSGHIDSIDCDIHPADTEYRSDIPKKAIANLKLRLGFFESMTLEEARQAFDERMLQADEYVQFLDSIIEVGAPITKDAEAAA